MTVAKKVALYIYAYELKSPRHIDRIGTKITGRVQVDRPYTDEEVFALAVSMNNVIPKDSTLVSVQFISGPNPKALFVVRGQDHEGLWMVTHPHGGECSGRWHSPEDAQKSCDTWNNRRSSWDETE